MGFSFSNAGFSETGFSDAGFLVEGFSVAGFSNTGFSDTGFSDTVFFLFIYVFFLCRSLDFPSRPKTPKKKSREFPLGGPSPCGKTGLAPCRQCTCSSLLVVPFFFSSVFLTKSPNPNPKIKDTKSDLQNHQEY